MGDFSILTYAELDFKMCGSIVGRRRGRKAHDIGHGVGWLPTEFLLSQPVLNPLKFRKVLNPFPIIVVQFVIATSVLSFGGAFGALVNGFVRYGIVAEANTGLVGQDAARKRQRVWLGWC